ncbi:MAG: FecR domain-containing protein [Deltaproteobacteria bacterium]|nr:FecR domain-containing protein [Deltaproteobacteria bacterium]
MSVLLLVPALSYGATATIDAANGVVYFKAKGSPSWGLTEKGKAVEEGDRIKTGSDGRASLVFADSTKLMLGNDTELEVTEFLLKPRKRSAVYSVSTGKVRAVVAKFAGKSDIKVKTPTGVAGVKGTDFIVMNQGDANVIFGKEGKVDVAGDGGGTVKLSAGKMTENTRGASPITPVAVEPGTALADARAELEAVTDANAPVEWERAGKLPDVLARWNINYGHYLAESKRYKEALDVFRIAIDLSTAPSTRAEAHLERGTVLSLYMNDQRSALAEYNEVIEKYPEVPFVANALYSAGKIDMDAGNKAEAVRLFKRYLSEFPQGPHRTTVEQLLRSMEAD